MSALQPPRINTTDPNQQELSDTSSDQSFSSASENAPLSPIPTTRVERVDDQALHGEIPGTPAYDQRIADAVPDEIEVIPEGQRSRSVSAVDRGRGRGRSHSQLSAASVEGGSRDGGGRPGTPGGSPIPKTVVEKVDDRPSYGEVEGTPAKEMRMADAVPDEVREAPREARLEGRLIGGGGHENAADANAANAVEDESEEGRQAWFRNMWERRPEEQGQEEEDEEGAEEAANDNGEDDDDFGDDFNEFAEGEGDEDFGDFDEADDEQPPTTQPQQLHQASTIPPSAPDILAGLPPLDFSKSSTPSEIQEAITPYINAILPNSTPMPSISKSNSSTTPSSPFLSDRSLSLWHQLLSPPPTHPPNWTRSRIRRLFLVSLGVPVDLDEILPKREMRRLVLPYTGLENSGPTPTLQRLKEEEGGGNESTTSLDSKTGTPRPSKTHRRAGTATASARAGPPPPPEFDVLAAARLAATTAEKLEGLGDEELRLHVVELGGMVERASGVLQYWLERKDEGLKEKEALEGVIENFVGFVKGRRGVSGGKGKVGR